MRVLALVPGGIGDQILFFPTIDDLKRVYPNAEIDVVVEPRAKDAYRVCKSVRETFTFDFKGKNSLADWGNLLGVIRDREYDVAFSLGQRWGIGLLLWLTGIPTRIGYGDGGQVGLLTNTVPLQTDQYAAAMYHDLLKGLNIVTPCPAIQINVPKKDIEWAEGEQKRLGLQGGGYVLIHGGSSELAKTKGIDKVYPSTHWATIIQDFQQRQPDLPIVLVQGPNDEEFVRSVLNQSSPALKVTSPADIGKLAALIAGCSLMLCTDSAPMHLAVALQVYTLALFGPTDPQKLLPNSDRFVAIQSSTGQIGDIPPETVLAKVWGG